MTPDGRGKRLSSSWDLPAPGSLFNADFYRSQLDEADALLDDAACLEHYLQTGWRKGLDPSRRFSTSDYLRRHPEIADGAVCPLVHHLLELAARAESAPAKRRRPRRSGPVQELDAHLFDETFYSAMHPDIAEAGIDAQSHFEQFGWREGRDPAPWFSVHDYLLLNPDVEAAQTNPFRHWLTAGRREGRTLPRRAEVGWTDVLSRPVVPVPVIERRRISTSMWSLAEIAEVGKQHLRGERGLVVVYGADDYRKSTGGVQACVRHEVDVLPAAGFDYLYLFPVEGPPTIAFDEGAALRPVLNGENLPVVRSADVAALAAALAGRRSIVRVVVHSLVGQPPATLSQQVTSMGVPADFWVHDFGAACSSYTLMRNDTVFCGGPPVDSGSCRVCNHGKLRPRYLAETSVLLANPLVQICAPSASAAEVLRSATGTDKPIDVVPHGGLSQPVVPQGQPVGDDLPTLAFLGHAQRHKGFEAFLAVHRWVMSRGGIRLLHLGATSIGLPGVEFHKVDMSTDWDMAEALLHLQVDATLLWPAWPETFSLVALESLAAGCAVVTHEGSGNVVSAARQHGNALVLESRRHLERQTLNGDLAAWLLASRAARPAPRRFAWTGLTPARLGLADEVRP